MTKKYEIVRGTFRVGEERKEAGDVVEIPESQRQKYGPEKFREVRIEGEEEQIPEHIPEDYDTLRAMASTYNGEEIDGRSSKSDIVETLEEWPEEDVKALEESVDE